MFSVRLFYSHVCKYAGASTESPRSRVADGCELSYRYWDLNPGPLQEQATISSFETWAHMVAQANLTWSSL